MTNDEYPRKSENQIPKTDRHPGTDSNFQSFDILSAFGIRVSSFPRLLQWQPSHKLFPVPLHQLPPMRFGVAPMFFSRGLFIDERFAAHFDINFLHLRRQ